MKGLQWSSVAEREKIDWYLSVFWHLSIFLAALSLTEHTFCCSYQTHCPLSDIITHDPLLLLSTVSHADSRDLSVWLTRLCEDDEKTLKFFFFLYLYFLRPYVNIGHLLGSKQNIQNLM